MFPQWRANFQFIDSVAKRELVGAPQDSSKKLLEWVRGIMRLWQFEQGGRWVGGGGLLSPKKQFVRLSKSKLQKFEPWQCAGPDISSELGLFLKLWAQGDKRVAGMLNGREYLLWKSFALLVLECRRPDDYFDARQAADLLAEHMLVKAFEIAEARRAYGASQRQVEANRKNAKKPRRKVRKSSFDVPTAEQLELLRKNVEKDRGKDYGWKSAAARRHKISRDTVGRIHAQLPRSRR